jgi:protein ImuB
MPRRILSIWLRALAIDRWQLANGESAAPFALLTETAHGPRIAAINAAARAAGVRSGTMLADARALCPELAVAPGDPAGDRALLDSLAMWAQRWGPWSALDPPDGLLVDVSGVAHLFGGEAALLADAQARLAQRGLTARLAIASTAGAAWALSHYGGGSLNDLPVAALRLDPATVLILRRLGLKRVGDLSGVARDAVARRFRNTRNPAANPLIRLDQLLGKVPEPLLPVRAVEVPLVQRRLLEPIRHRALLDQVLGDLCADLVRVLEGQALGARRLELGLWKVDGEVLLRRLELAAASRDPDHIAGLFGRKLDDVDAGFGIELARLRVPWAEPMALGQRDFEAAAEAHGTSLAAWIDRLTIRLGEGAVRRPVLHASHLPERAQKWESLLGAPWASAQGLRHQPSGWKRTPLEAIGPRRTHRRALCHARRPAAPVPLAR